MVTQRNKQWHDEIVADVKNDPEMLAEYEAYQFQLELATQLKKARMREGVTQLAIAEKLKTYKPVIARLEAGGGRLKHSPSLKTLFRYANALGYQLHFTLQPRKR